MCQETNTGGRWKLLSAIPPTLVFHLSVSHRKPLKFPAGWNSLVRLADGRFKKLKKYSLINRLSSDTIILKICLPTVQLRFSECLTKPLLINIVYYFYDTLVLQWNCGGSDHWVDWHLVIQSNILLFHKSQTTHAKFDTETTSIRHFGEGLGRKSVL